MWEVNSPCRIETLTIPSIFELDRAKKSEDTISSGQSYTKNGSYWYKRRFGTVVRQPEVISGVKVGNASKLILTRIRNMYKFKRPPPLREGPNYTSNRTIICIKTLGTLDFYLRPFFGPWLADYSVLACQSSRYMPRI